MTRRLLLWLACVLSLGILLVAALNAGLGRLLLERWVNQVYAGPQGGSVRVTQAQFTPPWHLSLAGGASLPTLSADEIAIELDGASFWRSRQASAWVGTFRVRQATIGRLALTDLAGDLWRRPEGYRVIPLTGRLGDGQLRGLLEFRTANPPIFSADLELTGVPLAALAPVNSTLFDGAEGTVRGTATLSGTPGGAVQFTGEFTVDHPGGAVQGPFLKSLMPYVPAAARTDALRRAAEGTEPVRFRTALLQVQSVTSDELKALLIMTLPEYNVNLDVEFLLRLREDT